MNNREYSLSLPYSLQDIDDTLDDWINHELSYLIAVLYPGEQESKTIDALVAQKNNKRRVVAQILHESQNQRIMINSPDEK